MFCLMPQRVLFLGCWLMIALNACRPAEKVAGPQSWSLLEGDLAQAWRPAGIPEEGPVKLDSAELSVGVGLPMTGAKFTRWQEAGIPDTHYRIEYETMRVEGEDIFEVYIANGLVVSIADDVARETILGHCLLKITHTGRFRQGDKVF